MKKWPPHAEFRKSRTCGLAERAVIRLNDIAAAMAAKGEEPWSESAAIPGTRYMFDLMVQAHRVAGGKQRMIRLSPDEFLAHSQALVDWEFAERRKQHPELFYKHRMNPEHAMTDTVDYSRGHAYSRLAEEILFEGLDEPGSSALSADAEPRLALSRLDYRNSNERPEVIRQFDEAMEELRFKSDALLKWSAEFGQLRLLRARMWGVIDGRRSELGVDLGRELRRIEDTFVTPRLNGEHKEECSIEGLREAWGRLKAAVESWNRSAGQRRSPS